MKNAKIVEMKDVMKIIKNNHQSENMIKNENESPIEK